MKSYEYRHINELHKFVCPRFSSLIYHYFAVTVFGDILGQLL